jgi:hypothetical protein
MSSREDTVRKAVNFLESKSDQTTEEKLEFLKNKLSEEELTEVKKRFQLKPTASSQKSPSTKSDPSVDKAVTRL